MSQPNLRQEDFTRITFKSDLGKFSMTTIDKDTEALLIKRVYDLVGSVKNEQSCEPYFKADAVQTFENVKAIETEKYISIFQIRPVKDYNELTHHYLEVLSVHLSITRGSLVSFTNISLISS